MGLSTGPDRDSGCGGRRVNAKTWSGIKGRAAPYANVLLHNCPIFFFPTETSWTKDDFLKGFPLASAPSQGLSGVAAPCVDNEPGRSN